MVVWQAQGAVFGLRFCFLLVLGDEEGELERALTLPAGRLPPDWDSYWQKLPPQLLDTFQTGTSSFVHIHKLTAEDAGLLRAGTENTRVKLGMSRPRVTEVAIE